uniref:histidine--tRNA ligase n=1 Tax=Spongospora subterranea TaxID=70186 RepID=A0A0H5RBF6_9EUKA|eukprot:CRZ11550.1 hypothetical protein [Spongospora subterranea]
MNPARGFRDVLPPLARQLSHIEGRLSSMARLYSYREVRLPIVERREVFDRPSDDRDHASLKELFSVNNDDHDPLCLRPEGTAGLVRCLSNEMVKGKLPNRFRKLWYCGPMFRHERPQAGRFRQFNQFGIESVGESTPYADIEVIEMACRSLSDIGLLDQTRLSINSLGDREARTAFNKALVEYLQPFSTRLSPQSSERLKSGNAFRILDSKDEGDREILKNSPSLQEYLSKSSSDWWASVLSGLKELGISYQHDPHLVRGLDYYSETAFEFIADNSSSLGKQQSTILAGGRYNDLGSSFSNISLPGVGWAAGIDRLSLLHHELHLQVEEDPVQVAVVALDFPGVAQASLRICQRLRNQGISVVQRLTASSASAKFRWANKTGAIVTIVIGSDEIKHNRVTVKKMATGEQVSVDDADAVETVGRMIAV